MKLFSKKRKDQTDNAGDMLDYETEDESYRRYKHRCYRNLILEALLAFLLGLLTCFASKL